MPMDTAIIVAGIVLVFAAFGATLVWADYYTRNVRTPDATYFRDPAFKTPDQLSEKAPRGGLSISRA